MLALLTADDLFSHIKMLAGSNKKLFVLVEGPTDCSIFDPHVDATVCETIPSGGKAATIGAIKIAQERGFGRAAAVVDADWDGILHHPENTSNVFHTEHYDIDATVFSPPQNIKAVTANVGDRDRIRTYLQTCGYDSIQDATVRIAFPLGVLRLASKRNGWHLRLRGLSFNSILNPQADSVDMEKLVTQALNRTAGCTLDCVSVVRDLEAEISAIDDSNRYRYCSGHDLYAAFATIMRAKCGGRLSSDMIAAMVRAAFSCGDVRQCSIFLKLASWGASNGADIISCLPAES